MKNVFIITFSDLIAIPDFGVGAMENWGLITYRETSILYEPEETSAASHQWVAVVVAHELAHQVLFDFEIFYSTVIIMINTHQYLQSCDGS